MYVSSKAVSFDEDYYPWINQFLSFEDDRSWESNQKAEFLIRMGQRWSAEVQRASGADTVIFINGDMDLVTGYIRKGPQVLVNSGDLDALVSLDSLDLLTRREQVSFIRSNKLLTTKRTIRHASLSTSTYLPGEKAAAWSTCYDEDQHKFPPQLIDMYADVSVLGKYCTGLFSSWWLEAYAGAKPRCSN